MSIDNNTGSFELANIMCSLVKPSRPGDLLQARSAIMASSSAENTIMSLSNTICSLHIAAWISPQPLSFTELKMLLYCSCHIYHIICLKSVDVRRMQLAILAQSPREMSQTYRILPRYFLSRVCVSIRPRIFLYDKTNRTSRPLTDRPGRMLQRHRPSERRNLKGSLYLHARWRLTSQFTQNVRVGYGWFVGAPAKPPQTKRKISALQRSSQARQRMRSSREEATVPTHPSPRPSLALAMPGLPPVVRPSSLDRPSIAGRRAVQARDSFRHLHPFRLQHWPQMWVFTQTGNLNMRIT